jgi:beta-mannosidase
VRALPTDSFDLPASLGEPSTAARAASVWPRPLDAGWQCVTTRAGACATPADLPADGWLAAVVPGTVASAWRAAGRLDLGHPPALGQDDHWYRVRVRGSGMQRLRLHGLATLAEVWLDGTKLLDSDSMFVAHDLDITLDGEATLALCFRSLAPLLAARRGRPRWRPRLVNPPALRNVRTTLLGHMPGWCPGVEAVGPWRPIEWLGDAPHAFDTVDIGTSVDGDDGIVSLTLTFVREQMAAAPARLACSGVQTELEWRDARTLTGQLRVPNAERWWPHTHGTPALHALALYLGDETFDLGRVGFRTIETDHGDDGNGFALRINDTPVFCRGACWTSADLATLAGTPDDLAHLFALARDAGMNMLRVGGTMVYESDTFYRLADEYGILIWQDFAFANFDYPTDDAFISSVTREATQFLARTRRFASLAVTCGGSEIDQQAAMFGLTPEQREQPLFMQLLPDLVARERPDIPYVTNSPSGGMWPFSTRSGITHYYGVSAYQRPMSDVRRSDVRFAAECLAFANIPDDATLHDGLGTIHCHDPRWKAAVPRDPGSGWDFDDVRDHYVQAVYGIEPARLRYEDPQRFLDLSRAIVAELMTDVFAEWRRAGSRCGGALVWQFQDLRPGAGWGAIDSLRRPKSAWHALAEAFKPVHIGITDEGLNGLDLHIVNETAQPVEATLELSCLRDGAVTVAQASREIELAPRSSRTMSAADCLGRFFDFTHAYRFGPRPHDVTIATLRDRATGAILAEAFHLPDKHALERHDLGITAKLEDTQQGWQLVLEAQRFARYVYVSDARYVATPNWFHLVPGRPRTIALEPVHGTAHGSKPEGEIRAINAAATVFYP